ncbi:hypothetical protein HY490_03020 [Candidatus Woesearchaeota archaeon]|nr:hypothetical protein [Candidatus Woesearchaeota archaeon]
MRCPTRLKKTMKWAGIAASGLVVALAATYGAYTYSTSRRNAELDGGKMQIAVLVSDSHAGRVRQYMSPLIQFAMYNQITRDYNSRGLHVQWILHATSGDFDRVRQDTSIDSVALIGHGSKCGFEFSDRLVNADGLEMLDLPKKSEFIQLTCSRESDAPSLGSAVADKSFYYDGLDDDRAGSDSIDGLVLPSLIFVDSIRDFKFLRYGDQGELTAAARGEWIGTDNIRVGMKYWNGLFRVIDSVTDTVRSGVSAVSEWWNEPTSPRKPVAPQLPQDIPSQAGYDDRRMPQVPKPERNLLAERK